MHPSRGGGGRNLALALIATAFIGAACSGSSDHPRLDLRAQKLLGGSVAQENSTAQAGRLAGIVKRAEANSHGVARAKAIDDDIKTATEMLRREGKKPELSLSERRAIYDRHQAGSVIQISRVTGKSNATAAPTFVAVPLCKNAACTITETATDFSDTVALGAFAGTPFVTKDGITLSRQTRPQTALGSVMDHSAFASFVKTDKVGTHIPGNVGGFVTYTTRYGVAGGDLTGSRPVTATWQGLMVGHTHPSDDDDPVDELLGGSTLAYDAGAGTVDVSLTGIKNLTENRPHSIEAITVPGLAVNATGEFAGGAVTEINGAFYGPADTEAAHAEAAGTIYHSGTGAFSGAFGAKRQ